MNATVKAKILYRSRIVPVAVVCENDTRYFIHSREVKLHEFKKYCKKMPPLEIVNFKKPNNNEQKNA